jgi:flagellar hook-basal body complex protein FliE
MAVESIAASQAAAALEGFAPVASQAPAARGFAETMVQAIDRVNAEQLQARDALSGLATGENIDLHGTMIALERAEIGLRAMVSVRDKLVGAYEQVMNMAL